MGRPGAARRVVPLPLAALLLSDEAVGKRFDGVDIANGDDELVPAITLRRHAEG